MTTSSKLTVTTVSSTTTPTTVSAATPPSALDDIKDLAFRNGHHVRMMFYPPSWKTAPSTKVTWSSEDFPPVPKSLIPTQPGVYVFVVMTNLFGFDHGNGLFYIGKATNLNERIDAYIGEIGKRFVGRKRPLVWRMINQWHGHLKYYYTTTKDVAEAEILEDQMLTAFQPPFNKQFDATTSAARRAFP